jgi:hypothetical protein
LQRLIVARKKILFALSLLAGIAGICWGALPSGFWSMPDVGSGFDYVVVVHSDDGADLAEFSIARGDFLFPTVISQIVSGRRWSLRKTAGFIRITVMT